MKESLSIFITAIILVLLIVIFPLYNYFEREDDMSYNLVLKATTSFIDEVIYCGYISQEMYTDYIFEIANTGNLYDIELEAHKKVLVESDDSSKFEEQYLIDYNNDIFSTEVTNTSNINDKVIKNGAYHLNVGDKIYIKLKNSSTTMAGALFNIIVPTSSKETIKINYGGIVQNNTWQQADTPIFEDFQIKLAFDLNTNGDNNANYNSDELKNGMVNTIYTGSKYTTFTIPNATPTRTNCTFKGWATTKNGTVKYNPNDQVKIDESLALYAVWQYNPITLTLNANGGTPETQSKTLTYGNQYTALSSATKPIMTGYNFDGWYTAADGGTKITSSTSVNSTNNVTLYAHWKAIQMTVTLNANGGSVTPTSFTGTYKQKYGTLPNPSRTGYDFNGWYTAVSGGTKITENTIINATTNHTLYAHYTAKKYTITFDGNGGSSGGIRTLSYDATLGTLPSSTKTGYILDGWYTAASGGTKITSTTKVTGDVTYYAHWTLNTYTVTYNANGGSSVASQNKTYNSTLGTLPSSTRVGYTLDGWYTATDGGTKITSTTKVTGNVTYYAHWKVNTYTITYNLDGGTNPSSNPASYTVETPTFTLNYPTKNGYTFKGWTGSNSTTTPTSATIAKGSTGNKSYTAHWGINSYTVTFNANGGSSVSSKSIEYNSTIGTLPESSRYGYIFDGWYTALTGGTAVTSSTKVTGNVIYYARWIPITYCPGKLKIQSYVSSTYPYLPGYKSTCHNADIRRSTVFNLKCDYCGYEKNNWTFSPGLDWCNTCGAWITIHENNKSYSSGMHYTSVKDGGVCGRRLN